MAKHFTGEAIGDYIHYRYKNYLQYGLIQKARGGGHQRPTKELTSVLNEQREQVYKQLRSQYNANLYRRLETELNNFTTGRLNGSRPLLNYSIQQHIFKKVQSMCSALTMNDIDWQTLTISEAGKQRMRQAKPDLQAFEQYLLQICNGDAQAAQQMSVKFRTLLSSNIGTGSTRFNTTSVMKHVNTIHALIQSLPQSPTKNDLTVRIANVKNRIKAIPKGDIALFNEAALVDSHGNRRNIRQELAAIAQATLAGASLVTIEGQMAEALVHHISDGMLKTMQGGVKVLTSDLLGSMRAKNMYVSSAFGGNIKFDQLFAGKQFSRHSGADAKNEIQWQIESFGGTQGKTDTAITFYANDKRVVSNTSIKSYNLTAPNMQALKQGMSLVQGTNMMYLFQNRAKFLNHYLNQTSGRSAGNPDTPPANTVAQANQLMQEMLVLLSFTGGGRRADTKTDARMAGIFIVNDKGKKNGGFKIVPVEALYQRLLQDNDAFKTSLPITKTWKNIWIGRQHGGKWQRITNMLMEVYSFKIDVSLDLARAREAIYTVPGATKV